MKEDMNTSHVGKLLAEISWEKATRYHNGGIGFENVLTVEVLQGLDFLPRLHFLAAVFRQLRGCNGHPETTGLATGTLAEQSEQAILNVLPFEQYFLAPSREHINIQPDAIVETPGVFALVEAKRIRSSAFQRGQLAREFALVTREAGDRLPLLILILGQMTGQGPVRSPISPAPPTSSPKPAPLKFFCRRSYPVPRSTVFRRSASIAFKSKRRVESFRQESF